MRRQIIIGKIFNLRPAGIVPRRPARRSSAIFIFWWLLAGLAIYTLARYLYLERFGLVIKRYPLRIKGLPSGFEGFTILHLSDLHNKQFGKKQTNLIHLIQQQKYDMVALTGDFVNKSKPNLKPTADLIRQLAPVPVYFVPGNHEWVTGFKVKKLLTALGIHILDNKAVKQIKNDRYIWILGVDDPHLGKARLNIALEETDASAPKILLAHSPNIYPEAKQANIDLVLCGHTHAGQVRFPFFGAIFAPGQGLFPQWDYGLYEAGATAMIISGGLGESNLPIRFNIRPEIVLITLFPALNT